MAALFILPLPRRGMQVVCDFAAAAMYALDGRGRRRSLENLRLLLGSDAAPGTPATARERLLVRGSYRNMARAVGHALWTCWRARQRVEAAGEMSPEGKRLLAAHRPVIAVSGHIGCWEILSQLAFLEGHRMMSVAKDIGTKGMTRLLMKARTSIGQEIVPAEGAFRPLMQGLREGKSLGLLVDQKVRPKHGGVWIRFLGRPMPVSAAPAFFAAKGKATALVAWSRPLRDGRYRCEIVSVHGPDEARDIWGFTQTCARELECVIRRHPSKWVLNYNYFSNTPREDDLKTLAGREAKAAGEGVR